MGIRKFLLIIVLMSTNLSYSMNITQLSEPIVECVTTSAQNVSTLALTHGPAVINFGIYNVISKLNKPTLVIFGMEAAVVLTLDCQSNSLRCLSSFITIDSLQAVTYLALENIGSGVTYAVGEEVAQQAIALARGNESRELAQTVLTTLAAAGMGFYAWSMDPSANQAMLLSMCSAVVLTSLTAASDQPTLKNIQQNIVDSLRGVGTIGKIIGVATIAAGTAAIAYQKSSSEALLNAVVKLTSKVTDPGTLASAQTMIRANYSWIEGYRWTKNAFKKWLY